MFIVKEIGEEENHTRARKEHQNYIDKTKDPVTKEYLMYKCPKQKSN